MRVIVTGCAGFIGSSLTYRLLQNGIDVVGIDCFLKESYPVSAKRQSLSRLHGKPGFDFFPADIREDLPNDVWDGVSAVVNLAAMPGLSKSWVDFDTYNGCNFIGVHRLLEQARQRNIEHFVQASTSSVYGELATGGESDPLDPISPYGVTKLAGERLVAAYGNSYEMPFTILRFFSVYGPWQRPDMAFHIIAERILSDETVTVFGDGNQSRSNTFVDDAVAAITLALKTGPSGVAMNIAGGQEVTLLHAINQLEIALGKSAKIEFQAARRGDQVRTSGDINLAKLTLGYEPSVLPSHGLAAQAEWHLHKRLLH